MKVFITTLVIFFCVISSTQAQFPGGVSASSTNKIWLDAYQMSATNGQAIQTWSDFSGNGTNANQIIGANRPSYKTNSINGMPAMDFDGVDDYMFIDANAVLNSNQSTHFVVYEKSTLNAGNNMIFNMGFSEASNLIYTYATPSYVGSYIKNSSNATRQFAQGTSSTNLIASYTWDGSLGTYKGFLNGVTKAATTNAANSATGNTITRIGSFNTNYRFNGDIAEIIYYTSILNSAERNIVENYLSAKYQINVLQDLYTHELTHRYDVIGIGQEIDGGNLIASGSSNLTLSATIMSNGDYVLAGHDDGGFGNNTTDVPSGYSRYNQVWRSTLTNYGGTVNIAFDVSSLGLGNDTSYKLLVDADGVFATGAVEYAGIFAGGIVSFTGVTLTSTSYFTLANSDFAVVSTGVTNDWHLTTTWSCGCIPSLGSDVNILTGHNVFINGQNAQVNSLIIDGSLSFNSTDTLQINGDLTNNNLVTAGAGTFNFSGASFAQNTFGALVMNNLTVDNSLGLTVNSSLGVQGWLDVVNGTITTSSNLTLRSNATGTAAYLTPETGEISGDVTVERFLDEGESYYLLGTVVANGTLEDWNQEFEMQGFTGTEWAGGVSSVYYFDQNNIVNDYNQGYTVPSSTFDIVDPKVGYEIYVGDDTKATGARTIDVSGDIVGGTVVYNCPHIAKLGVPADDGYSLVTNPYPAPIKFGYIIRSANFDKAYIKRSTGARPSINNQWVLGSGEAFFVHSNVGGTSMTFQAWMAGFDEDITDTYNFRSIVTANDPVLEIKLDYTHNAVIESDYTYIGFSNTATDIKDDEDAYKLNNIYTNKPNLSSINNGVEMETNILSINNSSIIPLNVIIEYPSTVMKSYTLELNNINDLLNHNKILILEDRALSTFTKLTQDTSYTFSMMDTITQSRFFLHISSPLTSSIKNVTCYGNNDAKIVVNGFGNDSKDYIWKDVLNNVIGSSSNINGSDSVLNLAPGIYTVEVTNNNTSEMVINTFEVVEPSDISVNFYSLFSYQDESNIVSTDILDTILVYTNQLVSFQNNSANATTYSWNFGDLTSSSLENPDHIYFNAGLYKVELTSSNGTCDKSVEQYVNVVNATGIDETNQLANFNVSVIDNNLTLAFDDSFIGNAVITLTNNLGQMIYNNAIYIGANHRESIVVDDAVGVYYVTVKNDKNSKTKKIVISNK